MIDKLKESASTDMLIYTDFRVNVMAKVLLWILVPFTTLFIVSTHSAYAQNRVVVVPLGGDVNKADLAQNRVWRGLVSGGGKKRGQGRFTSERKSTGRYTVFLDLDIPGLDTSESNIIGFGIPVVSIYFGKAGDTIKISGTGKSFKSGKVTSLRFTVSTYNSSNVLTDRSFLFHFMLNEFDGPSGSLTSGASLLKELYPDVKCTTEGDTQTCTYGEAP